MPHANTPLIATLSVGFALAYILGAIANRMRLSPLIGYLLAGIIIGPFTPGFIADQHLAHEISEIGVMLLMFGVGLHFSLKDLMSVKHIAIPGAVVQISVATLMGMFLAFTLGWNISAGLVFGLSLSVASTVVLLKALEERQLLDTRRGKIAVGWLIVEDLVMVITLVLLPALAGILSGNLTSQSSDTNVWLTLAITLGKVGIFIALMLVVGRKIIPWLLESTAGSGSRELFTLAILAIAMGIAFFGAQIFGVSFALGAFFAGMMLNESEHNHRAAEDSQGLRDAFAVLFFVAVGMLFDPQILIKQPLAVIGTVLVVIIGKSLAALFIVNLFGKPLSTSLTISAALAQIGEFSFILVALGVNLGLMPEAGRDLVLAAAILSIMFNPVCFKLIDKLQPWLDKREHTIPMDDKTAIIEEDDTPIITATNHAILVGHGRVGKFISKRLRSDNIPLVVIEDNRARMQELREDGFEVILGNAASENILELAKVHDAKWLIIAIPHTLEAGQISIHARKINPNLDIIVRAHFVDEVDYLGEHCANLVVNGDHEIAKAMFEYMGLEVKA